MLPDTNGPDGADARFSRFSPGSKSDLERGGDLPLIFDVVAAGVDGYTLKEVSPTDLVEAIRQVAGGNSYLHPESPRC